MKRFISGDRVRLITSHSPIPKGSKGTVILQTENGLVGVEWDKFTTGHDCAFTMYDLRKNQLEYLIWIAKTGRTEIKMCHGWNVSSSNLTKIRREKKCAQRKTS
jgi:hypothetical protein